MCGLLLGEWAISELPRGCRIDDVCITNLLLFVAELIMNGKLKIKKMIGD